MKPLDPRLHAVRPDLADLRLKGTVTAERYVAGEAMQVVEALAPLRRAAAHDAPLDTEAQRGERVRVFENGADGWCWAQLDDDGYVGWMPRAALRAPGPDPTHKVSALRTFVFSRPDIKSTPLQALSLGARLTIIGEAEDRNARYALVAPAGAVVMQHLSPLGAFETDWTAVAERFLGVPYLWGGKTSLGIDCSGLVQRALAACSVPAPRDSDMQAESVGEALPVGDSRLRLQRGDLVFWPGHVGIMRDAESLLHATAHTMNVMIEPLAAAINRLLRKKVEVSAIRRPSR